MEEREKLKIELIAILALLKMILKLEKVSRSSEKLKKGVKLENNRHLVTEKENRGRIKRKQHPFPNFVFDLHYLILNENKTVKLSKLEMFDLF